MELDRDDLNNLLNTFKPSWLIETHLFLNAFIKYVSLNQGIGIKKASFSDGIELDKLSASGLDMEAVIRAVHVLKAVHKLQERLLLSDGIFAVSSVAPKIQDNLVFGLYSLHTSLLEKELNRRVSAKHITKDDGGDYYCRGKKIPFDKSAIYFDIFDYLYSLSDNSASYEEIDLYLVDKKHKYIEDVLAQKKRIQNAVKSYVSNKLFPQKIKGVPVFVVKRGYGLELNNPPIF